MVRPVTKLDRRIGGGIGGIDLSAQPVPISEARARLAAHMAVLQSFGHDDIKNLGTLKIQSASPQVALLQKRGVVMPTSTKASVGTGAVRLRGKAIVHEAAAVAKPFSGAIAILNAVQPSVSGSQNSIPIDVAYWYGTNIVVADNTTIIIASDVKALYIIAETLTIGQNVGITWDQPTLLSPTPKTKPGPPQSWPTATSVGSERGRDGFPGHTGGQGAHGQPAPELELWFLSSSGFPAVFLRGQDGMRGGRGGDGGEGGVGQKGCPTEKNKGFCSQEQGPGGDGGTGGRAGDGGPGGNGGLGGRFSVYTEQPQLAAWLAGGATISVDGGASGAGGEPGLPGAGGAGGEKGDYDHKVCPKNNRTPGTSGPMGGAGSLGPTGQKGPMQTNSIRYTAITNAEFTIETQKPAIISTTPAMAFVGDVVTVSGLRFTPSDRVFAEGFDGLINVVCATVYISDTTLQFTLPNVPGGYMMFQVERLNSIRSANQASLLVRPRIDGFVPAGRIRPGEYYFLKGSGLGRAGNIWINGEEVGSFAAIDGNTVKFKARRPSNITANEAGEAAKLKAVNSEGAGQANPNHSAEVNVILDTFRVLVFGDSVMWGGGLPEHLKFYSLACDHISTKLGGIGLYRTVKAHHGAPIGANETTVKPEIPGEMSTKYPTIKQQVASLGSIPDASEIDLVLIDGGANDLPITEFMLNTAPAQTQSRKADLINLTHAYCYDDMLTLLQTVAAQYINAKIIVTGYYHIFSSDSEMSDVMAIYAGLVDGQAFPIDSPSDTKAKFVTLCDAWVTASNQNLLAAVNAINAALPGDARVFFVDPQTTPSNAAHAPNSFLWEPDTDITTLGGPTDPMWLGGRKADRETHKARLQAEPSAQGSRYDITKKNSSYHPNPAGAQNYFQKMIPALDNVAKSRRIALRASNGLYACAEGSGGGTMIANRPALGPWEVFEMVEISSNQAALRSSSGHYVCAEGGGGSDVIINRMRVGAWETFTLVPSGSDPSRIAFQSASGNYLRIDASAGGLIRANAGSTSPETYFTVL